MNEPPCVDRKGHSWKAFYTLVDHCYRCDLMRESTLGGGCLYAPLPEWLCLFTPALLRLGGLKG